jgi:hypothetical protein
MLGGGGMLLAAMLNARLCDEVNLRNERGSSESESATILHPGA